MGKVYSQREPRNAPPLLAEVANQLRANSKLTSTEYYMPVLELIFLRYHAFNRLLLVIKEV